MPNDADIIEATARDAFGDDRLKKVMVGSCRPATKLIKETFGNLGKELHYKVAASSPSSDPTTWDFNQWLYDMVWYVDGPSPLNALIRMPMVLESELHLGRIANVTKVNDDFQKLVQARADVRVWLAPIYSEEAAHQHIANCKAQAKAFSHAEPGDTYILIIYVGQTETTLIERFVNDSHGAAT